MRRLAVLLICLSLPAFAPVLAHAQDRAAMVGVQTVEPRTLTETVPVFAEVVTAREGAVASRVAGSVDRVDVLVGNRVEQGDVLVELNPDLLTIRVAAARAQVAEAEASVSTAQVRLESAETVFGRIEALRGSSSFSQGRFDDAQADVAEARAQLAEARARKDTAEARVEEASYELSRSKIRAPFTGIVLETNTIPGAYIQAGTPVVRLLDTESFEVQASVPSRYVDSLVPGQEVQAHLETGERLTLTLRAILPVEDPATRTRAVRLSAPDFATRANIADGQSLTVDIPVGPAREVLSVPKDALVQARGGWTVFVATDGKAMPRPVTIGVPSGDRYEVLSGLSNGDVVVVRGNERLRPGQDIAPSPVEGAGADSDKADTN
jgi:RND family efflux transporter MFP subunit